MLAHLDAASRPAGTRRGLRKLRLFTCAGRHRVPGPLHSAPTEEALASYERFADWMAEARAGEGPGVARAQYGFPPAAPQAACLAWLPDGYALADTEARALCELIRCVFGNPFR